MSTVINVSNETRENLLTSAIEGGSNYWYLIKDKACDIINKYSKRECFVEKMWDAILAGEEIEIHDIEDEDGDALGKISLVSIEKGEQIMAEKHASHFADIIDENDDACTGDVWFQLAVMGEIVYG